jgi:predicted nucleotidyltransferase
MKGVEELKKTEGVRSIILFGSAARGEDREISDLDLIVVVKNEEVKKKVEKIVNPEKQRLVDKLTGIGKSFVCFEKDLKERNFARIFSTEPILTKLLAPKSFIFKSLRNEGKLLYGENLLEGMDAKLTRTDYVKSYFTTQLLAKYGQLLILFNMERALKYAETARKWSYINTQMWRGRSASLSELEAKDEVFRQIRDRKPLVFKKRLVFILLTPLFIARRYLNIV